jgi:DNA cross-link repair 1C protein
MNNFDGQLHLYPEICIDNFNSRILFNSTTYCFILTHFHDDHMKNLESGNFISLLSANTDVVKFLCTSVTANFILNSEKYKHLYSYCTIVTNESPIIISLSGKQSIVITFYAAGHCPGSVMVLIEGSRGNVLFTGDFRLPINSAKRLEFIKQTSTNDETLNTSKHINSLYIDMTFFKPEINFIPSRDESVQALLDFIHRYIEPKANTNRNNFKKFIYLQTSARIGYETIFDQINKTTGFKIHVNESIYKLYEKLPSIQSLLTLDPHETPIHSCLTSANKMPIVGSTNQVMTLPCDQSGSRIDSNIEFIYIKISTMWFIETKNTHKILVESKISDIIKDKSLFNKHYRLCFSFHSSFDELCDFVNTIKPDHLYPIALPDSMDETFIKQYFKTPTNENESKSKSKQNSIETNENMFFKLLNNDSNKRSEQIALASCDNSSCDSLNFGSDDENKSKKSKKLKKDSKEQF